ncbi:hypothetical protein Q3G72_018563 [Acer saccharum]|nr:hypothetical protein Q3G72_018563 [Acer saccharum]
MRFDSNSHSQFSMAIRTLKRFEVKCNCKLGSSDLLSFARQEPIHADLKKWENTLRKISAVLEDAEEKQ